MVKSKCDFAGMSLSEAISTSKAEFIRQNKLNCLHELFITDTVRALHDKYARYPARDNNPSTMRTLFRVNNDLIICDFEDWCYNH